MPGFQIIQKGELYPLFPDCYIISGYPCLYIKSMQMVCLGDLHIGQQIGYEKSSDSLHLEFTSMIDELSEIVNISTILINGDLKHYTNSIDALEAASIQALFDHLRSENISILLVEGNHDKQLYPIVNSLGIQMQSSYHLGDYFFHHGHLELAVPAVNYVIISHEHPAYTFRGYNNARFKLPAFVVLYGKKYKVIVLPAASAMSLGTDLTLRMNKFISPLLKATTFESMDIFPFSSEMGLFELPTTKL